jgi:hypothetical protein
VDQHFPDITALTPAQSAAIHAYVIDAAWKAYERQRRGDATSARATFTAAHRPLIGHAQP